MPFEARVVDVSVYQGTIDWAQVKAAGIYAAVIRAGYGRYAKQEDLRFAENYADAQAAGNAATASACCNTCSTLICCDCLCECCGGDLIPCC